MTAVFGLIGARARSSWLVLALLVPPLTAQGGREAVRVATFNTSLFRLHDGELAADLAAGCPQARAIAAIVQTVRPDVLLLQELDYDADRQALQRLLHDYLAVGQDGQRGIDYAYVFTAPVNTGVPSGLDLDHDGKSDGPADALGFGAHPGEYGMALLSRFPIRSGEVRTFRHLLWRDVPDARLPDDPTTEEPNDWYSAAARAVLPLSSKSHWDVPVELPGGVVHLLICHPTPPVFDGKEDRNGRRNADEIRLWSDYLTPDRADWIVDDDGHRGGLPAGVPCIVMGDLNADPVDGDAFPGAIAQLLSHPRLQGDVMPTSKGAVEAAQREGGANARQRGNPAFDTEQTGPRIGNLKLDYVLPSRGLTVKASGVFWPASDEPGAQWIGTHDGEPTSSDHHLLWVDLVMP